MEDSRGHGAGFAARSGRSAPWWHLIAAAPYQATTTSTSVYPLVMGVITAISAYLLAETHRPTRAPR